MVWGGSRGIWACRVGDMGVEVGAGTTKVGVVTVGVEDEGVGVEAWLLQAARAARTGRDRDQHYERQMGASFHAEYAMYSPNSSIFLNARKTRVGSRFLGFQRRSPTRHEISCRQGSPPPDESSLAPPSVQFRLTSVHATAFAADIAGALKGVIVARGCRGSGGGGGAGVVPQMRHDRILCYYGFVRAATYPQGEYYLWHRPRQISVGLPTE